MSWSAKMFAEIERNVLTELPARCPKCDRRVQVQRRRWGRVLQIVYRCSCGLGQIATRHY